MDKRFRVWIITLGLEFAMPALREELKQEAPFDSPEHEAIVSVLRTHELIQIQQARLFRSHGITDQQYNVLRILRGAGAPLPSLEIASRMITVVPAITGLIDRLEKLGHVARERSADDRRVVLIHLTESGRGLLAALDGPLRELHHHIAGHLGARKLKQLTALLEEMRARIQ